MRNTLFALIALSGAAYLAGSSPAAARDYRYCLVESRYAFGRCDYDTMAQCRASASGRAAYCQLNTSFAFAEQGAKPRKIRRHHRYHP